MRLIDADSLIETLNKEKEETYGHVTNSWADFGKHIEYYKYFCDRMREEPKAVTRDQFKRMLILYFDINNTYTYNLTRHKSAFGSNNVTIDDFEEFCESDIDELVDEFFNYFDLE